MKQRFLNIQISNELYEKLKKKSESKGLSLAGLVRLIASEYLEKENRLDN